MKPPSIEDPPFYRTVNLRVETDKGKQVTTQGHLSMVWGWMLSGFVEGVGLFVGEKLPNGWKVLEWNN